MVAEIVGKLNEPSIIALPFTVCNNQEELDAKYAEHLEAGQEGQMINTYSALYQSKRTSDLLKRKEFQDAEFRIVDILEGKGERAGCAKLVLDCNGELFESSLKGSVEHMKEVYQNRTQYIGKLATIRYQNLTPDRQVPRFGVCVDIGRTDT